MDIGALPEQIRYVKNGAKGKWWETAKTRNQVHLGWRHIPGELLANFSLNKAKIEQINRQDFDRKSNGKKTFAGAITNDFNQLTDVLESPSQYIWITFEENRLWWCTVKDGAIANPNSVSESEGHFWLECNTPWRCTSLNEEELVLEELSGKIKLTTGFRGTICRPKDPKSILRKIRGIDSKIAKCSREARQNYEKALLEAIKDLHDRDFEDLVDLIFQRSGWSRTSRRGKTMKNFDLFVENPVTMDCAYVQIKTSANKKDYESCAKAFLKQAKSSEIFFFVYHTPESEITSSTIKDDRIHVWKGAEVAKRAVSTGLGLWIESKLS